MQYRLDECPAPSAEELDTLVQQRPLKKHGCYVFRFNDLSGTPVYERVTSGWSPPRWYRLARQSDHHR